jgi:SAM-dependent methyltransferase
MKLVVFDPPHDIYHRRINNNSSFQNNFGNLDPNNWQRDLRLGLKECFRVLKQYGVLIFKWNTHDAKINRILPLLPTEPLFMNKITKINTHNSETIWFCFIKIK